MPIDFAVFFIYRLPEGDREVLFNLMEDRGFLELEDLRGGTIAEWVFELEKDSSPLSEEDLLSLVDEVSSECAGAVFEVRFFQADDGQDELIYHAPSLPDFRAPMGEHGVPIRTSPAHARIFARLALEKAQTLFS